MNMKVVKIFICSIALAIGFVAKLSATEIAPTSTTTVEVSAKPERVEEGGTLQLDYNFTIPKGWHIYGRTASNFGSPTKISPQLPEGFVVQKEIWQAESSFAFAGEEMKGYADKTKVSIILLAPKKFDKLGKFAIKTNISMIQCADTCIPVDVNTSTDVELVRATPTQNLTPTREIAKEKNVLNTTETTQQKTLFAILLGAFLGGAILNLMPCVFPVIGLKIMSFASNAKHSRKSILLNALFYTLGILLSFLALALILILFKNAGTEAGWGFQLQNPRLTFFVALLFFAMGLSFAGCFEMGANIAAKAAETVSKVEESTRESSGWAAAFGERKIQENNAKKQWKKYAVSFLSGALAVLVASPCTAPFMGSAVGYALTANVSAILTFAVFASLGMGMAAPYILLSAIPSLSKILPRPGEWMQTLKYILSIPLFASAIWLLWVFEKQVEDVVPILWAALALAVGLRIYGLCQLPHYSRITRRFGAVMALISIFIASYLGTSPYIEKQTKSEIAQDAWSAEKVEKFLKEGTPVYVDFTAAWCVTCQFNEKILHSTEVKKALKEKGVKVLVGDWTNKNEIIRKELAKFGRAGVPLNLLYSPSLSQPQVMPAILTPAILLEAIDKIK